MHKNILTGTPEHFELISYTKPVPVFITGTLLSIGVLMGLTPLIVIFFVGFNPGFLLGIVFAGFIAFRLIRIVLWNAYGREIIRYSNNKLTQQYDYRMYQSKPLEFDGTLESVSFPEISELPLNSEVLDSPEQTAVSIITFHIGEYDVKSTLPVDVALVKDFFKL